MLYFITGNKDKFQEVKLMLPEIEQLDLDLTEIQSIDPKEIIEHKLQEALKQHQGDFIIEDTGLYMDSLNGLPGPLIKWFMKTVGAEGLYKISEGLGNNKAEAKVVLGYARANGAVNFFEGAIKGTIVAPRTDSGFGWDPVFQPDGSEKSFAQMSKDEKNEISHRGIAVRKLREFLEGKV